MTANNVTSSNIDSHDEKESLISQEQSEKTRTKDNSSNRASLIQVQSCPNTFFLRQSK